MQHINHSTTHLQNVNMCRLISKCPFRTNPEIYNHVCTLSVTQLHKQMPHTTPHKPRRLPASLSLRGRIPLPWEMCVTQQCVWPCCSLRTPVPLQGRIPLQGRGHTLRGPCLLSLAGCVPFPPASQGRMLNPAWAGGLLAAPNQV